MFSLRDRKNIGDSVGPGRRLDPGGRRAAGARGGARVRAGGGAVGRCWFGPMFSLIVFKGYWLIVG